MSKKKKTIEELLEEALVSEDGQPFQVPENWVWTKLGFIGEISSSKRVLKSDWKSEGIPFYRAREIVSLNKNEKIKNGIFISEELYTELALKYGIPKEEDLLITAVGTIGQSYIVKKEDRFYFKDASVIWFKNNTKQCINFINLFFKSRYAQNQIKGMSAGTTVDTYTISNAKQTLIPLPPLNEQKRIADKVERLLSKIEEAKQLIEEAKETFELRRAAILDKAFRGELTRKWREKNADIDIFEVQEHLDRLRADKESSPIKSNTLNVNSVNEVDEPFNLPRGWKWARLGELSYYVTSGSRDWSKYYADNGSYFIRTQDINKNKLNLTNVAYVLLPEKVEGKRSLVEPFDLLTTITGANVGKCAIVEETIPEAYVSQSVALTKLIDKSMAKYVHLSLLSTCGGGGELENRAYGIGRPVLSLEDIKNIRLPIAPYRERQVMVNMVKKLLDMEETTGNLLLIEEKLDQLKNSILSKAFRGKLGTNDPTEENAIELLKEVLQEQVK
ncbi:MULTISPECIES: restriction endonuclease subunit S [Bacillus amyloliquefaciens group]|uniref:restriction endonuclease subunit S n=1 Tax=Bacillus amyloliquefaciens group TaxID=1938374 RepID=UPI0006A91FF0|nr:MULTISPECIES: restriction endonuclease subunit S [Bacillus amyloliquefaciens group]QHQ56151.1 restriction endonuclease [Bacillus velezensis]RDY87820.1 restriction endonuclease [Bacillus velezensis]UBM15018.1 restriction endonuclease subunit S [Bacillus velezensis]CUB28698.1 Type-1 restriction enzyme EcoKI specificity protein [Bacillus amyloliquefaciens]